MVLQYVPSLSSLHKADSDRRPLITPRTTTRVAHHLAGVFSIHLTLAVVLKTSISTSLPVYGTVYIERTFSASDWLVQRARSAQTKTYGLVYPLDIPLPADCNGSGTRLGSDSMAHELRSVMKFSIRRQYR